MVEIIKNWDIFSDENNKRIASRVYNNFKVHQVFNVPKVGSIGYVNKVVNKTNDGSGLDAYVISNAKDPKKASNIAVMYRGSNANFLTEPGDAGVDWVSNDIPAAVKIISGVGGPTQQMKNASSLLNQTLKKYPNAKAYVYGHSLGSMDAQYALANIDPKNYERIKRGFAYEGPNIYSLLSDENKKIASKLAVDGKLFNYVDERDIVPLGYEFGKKTVGIALKVDSKKAKSIVDQHMWKGYQFDKKTGKVILTQMANTEIKLKQLKKMYKQFRSSGSGVSKSEKIFLDSAAASVIANDIAKVATTGLDQIISDLNKANTKCETIWDKTKQSARKVSPQLSESEMFEALKEAGATHKSIVDDPQKEYKEKIKVAKALKTEFNDVKNHIGTSSQQQVADDIALAAEWN
ncbi:Mbeg1-like protein [Companilactobacillus mishanensis]|uniref:DUF2974 domain-containing protein n=1 Tax=Companilactobacillus mishanensis TaxID=2486008 RepID=A0A5P0ZJX2_9LACO|nr:Mbeg1-like protein [Companilactobacillus mishanensis]MQS53364.1 DUF2974 domain-containing protein [Companilactobacillus mishanensis]